MAGESKITSQSPTEIFKTVVHLRRHDEVTRRFLRFAIVDFSGLLVNAVTLGLFAHAAVTESIAHLFTGLAKTGYSVLLPKSQPSPLPLLLNARLRATTSGTIFGRSRNTGLDGRVNSPSIF